MNIENQKYALLSNIIINQFDCQTIYRLKIADVKIDLKYRGYNFNEVKYFLETYFIHFETFNSNEKADVEIQYINPGDASYGNKNWQGWNEWRHEIELIDFNDLLGLMQRDFVAKFTKDFKSFYAIGPEWSFATCDSLDNLISYVLTKHVVNKEALVLHAACVVEDEQAYVFFGRSGAGKSTIAEFSYNNYGLKVISSDQVLLKFKDNMLYAQVVPTTIPEFPLEHPAREKKMIPVKALIHLIKSNEEFTWMKLSDADLLRNFMRELVYRNEFANEQKLFDLALKIVNVPGIMKGEMSYEKNSDFLKNLKNIWSECERC